jgi:hypothetical protein
MNREDVLRMAQEAGIVWRDHTVVGSEENLLELFAALVAAHEREACAKVCEDAISSISEFDEEYVIDVGRNVCTNLAKRIKARGEK